MATRAATFGDTPFYLQPFISLRGAPIMRHQGEQVAQIEAELRWQFWNRFSVVGFAGAGAAWNDFERLHNTQTIVTGGFGFRYEIARKYGIQMGLISPCPDNAAVYVQVEWRLARPVTAVQPLTRPRRLTWAARKARTSRSGSCSPRPEAVFDEGQSGAECSAWRSGPISDRGRSRPSQPRASRRSGTRAVSPACRGGSRRPRLGASRPRPGLASASSSVPDPGAPGSTTGMRADEH